MTIKEKIIEISDQLLSFLLEYRKTHPDFRFWLRSREHNRAGDGKRLSGGQWFQGSDYIFLSFHSASGHVNMTRSIGWVVQIDNKLNPHYHISVVFPREKDQKKIDLYNDIIKNLGGFIKTTENKYQKDLPDQKILDSLQEFLSTTLPRINEIIKEHGLSEIFTIPENKFRDRLDKILSYREKLKSEKASVSEHETNHYMNVENYPLNLILYGPPGTGKTYKLQSLCKDFIITKTVQTREEYLDKLVSDLKWWETVAASMMELKRATVPQLEKHEYVSIKSRQSGTKNVKQLLWGSLQSHTDPIHANVQVARRIEPFIFKKEENSVWTILEENTKSEVPEVINFLSSVTNFKPSSGNVQRNYSFVTFHQNFTYEDFVEGIKPVFNRYVSEELEYEIKEGVFYQACTEAAKLAGYKSLYDCLDDIPETRREKISEAPPFALFIDEINRANVSSVLGELITLIEEDKRLGMENEITDIVLPYSKEKFGVPGNLYIIGSMNTADRSVEALDTALRRRFSFEELQSEPSILNGYFLLKQLWIKYKHTEEGDEEWEIAEKKFMDLYGMNFLNKADYRSLKPDADTVDDDLAKLNYEDFKKAVEFKNGLDLVEMLEKINVRLKVLLDHDHTIGHAWLMNIFSLDDLKASFKNKILPLLKEFFYNDYAKIGLVLGKGFVETKQVGQKVFADFDGNELASEYADKVIYILKDPFDLTVEDFISIYK